MKTIILGTILLGFALSAGAVDKAQLDQRVRLLTSRFEALQSQPDKRIPAELLRQARGVILLDSTKAGFFFAYQGGSGVELARDRSGHWSPAAFVRMNEASLGPQIGGEQNFVVILLMNPASLSVLTELDYEFGGEARGTAGNDTAGVEGNVSSPAQPMLVFADRKGLYGGVSIKNGAIAQDEKANRVFYGQFVTAQDILFDKKVEPAGAAVDLAAVLTENSESHGP